MVPDESPDLISSLPSILHLADMLPCDAELDTFIHWAKSANNTAPTRPAAAPLTGQRLVALVAQELRPKLFPAAEESVNDFPETATGSRSFVCSTHCHPLSEITSTAFCKSSRSPYPPPCSRKDTLWSVCRGQSYGSHQNRGFPQPHSSACPQAATTTQSPCSPPKEAAAGTLSCSS